MKITDKNLPHDIEVDCSLNESTWFWGENSANGGHQFEHEAVEAYWKHREEAREEGRREERERWRKRAMDLAVQADCEPHPWAKDWHPRQVLRFLVADVIDRPHYQSPSPVERRVVVIRGEGATDAEALESIREQLFVREHMEKNR